MQERVRDCSLEQEWLDEWGLSVGPPGDVGRTGAPDHVPGPTGGDADHRRVHHPAALRWMSQPPGAAGRRRARDRAARLPRRTRRHAVGDAPRSRRTGPDVRGESRPAGHVRSPDERIMADVQAAGGRRLQYTRGNRDRLHSPRARRTHPDPGHGHAQQRRGIRGAGDPHEGDARGLRRVHRRDPPLGGLRRPSATVRSTSARA